MVLAFFKSTCPTCRLSFPVYARLERAYGDAIPIVAIAQDPLDVARRWLDERGFAGPAVDDARTTYAVSRAYEIDSVPTLVLVRDGTVTATTEGWDRDEANAWAQRLAEVTGHDPIVVSTPDDGLPDFKPG